MKICLKPNKFLFFIFFIINAAGYDYENNKNGMYPARVNFREKGIEMKRKNKFFSWLIEYIKKMPLKPNEYIRLANLIINAENKNYRIFQDKELNSLITEKYNEIKDKIIDYINLKEMKELFNKYKDRLLKVLDYKEELFYREIKKVLRLFNLPKNFPLSINIHLNLLDSYNRATNYFLEDKSIISISLNSDGRIAWGAFRHEYIHLLLKKIYKSDLANKNIKIPVNKNYEKDNQRVKFEENFIQAANLFFIDDRQKRQNNLNYFFDIGYTRIKEFYDFIEKQFVGNKVSLSEKVLQALIKSLE